MIRTLPFLLSIHLGTQPDRSLQTREMVEANEHMLCICEQAMAAKFAAEMAAVIDSNQRLRKKELVQANMAAIAAARASRARAILNFEDGHE